MANPQIRRLGRVPYAETLAEMVRFTTSRTAETPDEIWLLEHPPVFTLGLNADRSHVLEPGTIPVVPTDRGGQVTYHGPGQLLAYLLLDLRRAGLGIRDVVDAMENSVIGTLARYGVEGRSRREAPGVYVGRAKIASVGLRIRRGFSYHGLALNVHMDLEPFSRINPCGYAGLAVTQLADLGGPADLASVAGELEPHLLEALHLR
jgi:lipoyl(octanoyl) transferase